MCLTTSNIRGACQWNWEGDTIIHDPIIMACRQVPGTSRRYNIDIQGIHCKQGQFRNWKGDRRDRSKLPAKDRALFLSRRRYSFDFRLRCITAYLSEHIAYESQKTMRADTITGSSRRRPSQREAGTVKTGRFCWRLSCLPQA